MTSFWIGLGGDGSPNDSLVQALCKKRQSNEEMLTLLLENGFGDDTSVSFVRCIDRKNFKMAKMLVERGFGDGDEALAALIRMIKDGKEEVVKIIKMMIERGAKIADNHSAFYNAVRYRNENFVKKLIDIGASA